MLALGARPWRIPPTFREAQTPLDSDRWDPLGLSSVFYLTEDTPSKSLIDKKLLHELLAGQPSMFP